jgi:phosphoglucosamine mutase
MALFGTDGIRGLANGKTLTAEIAVDVAVAAAHILVESISI